MNLARIEAIASRPKSRKSIATRIAQINNRILDLSHEKFLLHRREADLEAGTHDPISSPSKNPSKNREGGASRSKPPIPKSTALTRRPMNDDPKSPRKEIPKNRPINESRIPTALRRPGLRKKPPEKSEDIGGKTAHTMKMKGSEKGPLGIIDEGVERAPTSSMSQRNDRSTADDNGGSSGGSFL